MKLVIILILLSIGAVAALGFLGQQMGIDPIKVEAPKLPSFDLPSSASNEGVYKWKDSNGQWHFGDAPPDNAGMLQQVSLDPAQNVVRAFKTEVPESEKTETPATAMTTEPDSSQASPGQMMLKMQQQLAEEKIQSAPITPSEILMKLQQQLGGTASENNRNQ